MTNERYRQLELTPDATLTLEEMKEGWHFCIEFDYLTTQGEILHEDGITCICGFDRRKVSE